MNRIYARQSVSVTDLKRSYPKIVKAAANGPVAVLNHNRPEAYLISAEAYERIVEVLEDIEDARLVRERANEPTVAVTLDEL
jgi:antitoxin StbD